MIHFAHSFCDRSQNDTKALFYSNNEKILFLICRPDVSDPKILKKLLKNSINNFSKIASVGKDEVKTMVISESQNYKNMRVFYATTTNIPKDALELTSKAWTMQEFLKL